MSRSLRASALGIASAVALFHLMLVPKVADADSFYHLGHAAQYLQSGPLDTSFPWTAFSAVGVQGADMWWGFHLLLMPFALLPGVAVGIGVAGMLLTTLLLAGVLWISLRHGFVAAGLWPIFLFVAVPNVLFRYVMVRPEIVSLLLALILLALLARGRPSAIAVASAGVTFFHLSMFWLPPAILGAYLVARTFDRVVAGPSEGAGSPEGIASPAGTDRSDGGGRRSLWAPTLAVVAGTAAGWLLRPHPLAAAKLAWIQIGLLLTVKAQGGDAPLTFAVSLAPLDVRTFFVTAGPLAAVWTGAVALALAALVRRSRLRAVPAAERHLLWTSHLLAAAFLVMTLSVARRSLVQWEAFAVLGVAASLTHLAGDVRPRRIAVALAVAVAALLPWSIHRHALNVRLVATEPDHLREVGEWLRDNTRPGDVVFNTHWDQFGPLFAHDRVNRYLGGMDPIFQYAYDPVLYWRFHYLSTDRMAERTCSTYPCTDDATVETWSTLVQDFGARWVLAEPRRNPRLSLYLLQDPRFELARETQHEAIFRVLDEAPRVPAPAPDEP